MVIRFIMSFLAALALNIRFDIPQDMNHLASESKMLNIFYNFQGSLTGTMAAATMVFVLLCIIDRYLYKNKGKVHRTPVLFLICRMGNGRKFLQGKFPCIIAYGSRTDGENSCLCNRHHLVSF